MAFPARPPRPNLSRALRAHLVPMRFALGLEIAAGADHWMRFPRGQPRQHPWRDRFRRPAMLRGLQGPPPRASLAQCRKEASVRGDCRLGEGVYEGRSSANALRLRQRLKERRGILFDGQLLGPPKSFKAEPPLAPPAPAPGEPPHVSDATKLLNRLFNRAAKDPKPASQSSEGSGLPTKKRSAHSGSACAVTTPRGRCGPRRGGAAQHPRGVGEHPQTLVARVLQEARQLAREFVDVQRGLAGKLHSEAGAEMPKRLRVA